MSPRVAARIAVVAASLLAACSTPLPSLRSLSLSDWLELHADADRFVLLGDVPQAELEGLARDLATFLALVDRLIPTPKVELPARFFVTSERTFELFLPSSFEGVQIQHLEGSWSLVRRSARSSATRENLLHEYTHYLVRKGRALRYPRWYDEGFAELLSTIRRREELVALGSPPSGRLEELARLQRLDLSPVFAAEGGDWAKVPGFYAIAWAATHYLALDSDRNRRMLRMLSQQTEGVPWHQAYAEAFALPLEDLSRRVSEHIEALRHGVLSPLLLDAGRLAPDLHWRVQALAPAEVSLQLADLALHFESGDSGSGDPGLSALATALLARAVELAPGNARARAGLALCRALRGEWEAALPELERALREAPDDPAVETRAGETWLLRALAADREGDEAAAREAHPRARRAYQRAVELDPGSPSAWAGLGRTHLDQEDPRPGIDALLRARDLGAWDSGVALDLAQLYAAAGEGARARELGLEVLRITDREADRRRARQLLAELADPPPLASRRPGPAP